MFLIFSLIRNGPFLPVSTRRSPSTKESEIPQIRFSPLFNQIPIEMGCKNVAWIQLCGAPKSVSLIDPTRFESIVRGLPDPERQTPSIVIFLGRKVKNDALRQLFPYNNVRRTTRQGVARIRLDHASSLHHSPLLFADADLTFEVMPTRKATTCHPEFVEPVRWQPEDMREIFDHAFTRVILASSNLLLLFANDFRDLSDLAGAVTRWINLGMLSDAPRTTRPRLLLVVKGTTCSREDIRALYCQVQSTSKKKMTELFSQVSTVYLEADGLSAAAVFRPLKEEILRQLDGHRADLFSERWIFSAVHLAALFRARLQHAARYKARECSIVSETRKYCSDLSTYSNSLLPLIRYGRDNLAPYESTASFIASSILMDAYPNKAHSISTVSSLHIPRS